MKKIFIRILIFILKKLEVPLISHAYIQMGISCFNNFQTSGENQVLRFIKKVKLLNGSTLIDIGANNGDYSLLLNNVFEDANIYSFEPMKEIYEEAQKVLAPYSNTKLFKYGMHSSVGKLTLYNSSDNHNDQISTSYKQGLVDFYGVDKVNEFQIDVNTLDNFCAENGLDTIDFLKIDVEGGEMEVLKGADKLLANEKICAIQFEFNDFNVSSRTFMKDFYDKLVNYNFYRITSKGLIFMGKYSTNHEIFIYQNILALRKSSDPFKKNVKF